jgi:hypothetical protein
MEKIKKILVEKRIEKLLTRRMKNSKQNILDTQELIRLTKECKEKGWIYPYVADEMIKSYEGNYRS